MYEKTQNTKVHVYSVFAAAIKNKRLKERALFSIQYLQTTRGLDIKGTINEYTDSNGQHISKCRMTHKPRLSNIIVTLKACLLFDVSVAGV